ncbi:MAG: fasciclin domain-containing protein [Prevotella sp.]|nr:fasciclin domain-containing protein [Prevotella sp.]
MKINHIFRNMMGITVAALAFVACADEWDDHYSPSVSAGQSIWQTIQQNSELSNFARVVQATGYDDALASSQMFTVFAPTNSAFSSVEADNLIAAYQQEKARGVKDKENSTIKEFLQNHIALYNYSTSSLSNDSITMMNGKYMVLTHDRFGNRPITSANQLASNGVLFTIGEKADYFRNVFEWIRYDQELDSLANFLYSYNQYEFDPTESVPGGIEDGKTVYLDSVTVLRNDLLYSYSGISGTFGIGRINSEDSTYWMVAPTNQVWDRLVAEYTPYYNYENTVDKRDSLQWANTRLAIVKGTVFSRTKNTDASLRDSAVSVNAVDYTKRKNTYGSSDLAYYQYSKPYDQGGIFTGTVNTDCSNGMVMKTNDWKIDKRQTFYQTIINEGESRGVFKEVNENNTATPSYRSVETSNPFYNKVSNNRFVVISPLGATNPEVVYYLPEMLSNIDYDLYVVMVPAKAGDTLVAETQVRPCKFRCSYKYYEQSGKELGDSIVLLNGEQSYFTTNPEVVDTVFLGTIRVPTCSVGLIEPQVTLRFASNLSNRERRDNIYTQILRIDCIIVKPHEE